MKMPAGWKIYNFNRGCRLIACGLSVVLFSGFAPGAPQKKKGQVTQANTVQSTGNPVAKKNDASDTGTSPQAKSAKELAILGADYIPCKFTLAELRGLQAPDIAPTLSPYQVEELQTKVVNAAAEDADPSNTGPALSELIKALSERSFTDALRGLTPSQALNQIITAVRKNRDHTAMANDTDWYVSIVVGALVGVNVPAIESTKTTAAVPPGSGGQAVTSPPAHATLPVPPSTSIPAKELASLTASIRALANVSTRGSLLGQVQQLVLASKLQLNEKTAALVALSKGKPLDEQGLIDAARRYLAQFERPPDVGCAMSLLSWREVEFAFGYLIANEYIAVQVVVRNLNDTQEFVLHDVEFEVDADPSGRLGRFYSGRDKVVVRAMANTQSTGDPRNLSMSVATGIGGIMSAAQTIFGGSLVNAAGVYNGAFLTAFGKGWKDLSGDQLKMIDDNTFSSTASSQQSVPKSGTVVFYTFIPAKQFQEGWWTQPCVEKTYLGTVDSSGNRTGLSHGVYAQQGVPLPTGTVQKSDPPAGIDVERALAVCAQPDDLLPRRHSWWSSALHRGPLLETPPDTCLAEVATSEPSSVPGSTPDVKPKSCKSGLTQTARVPSPTPVSSADSTAAPGSNPPPAGNNAALTATKAETSDNSVQTPAAQTFDLFRNAYAVPYRKWSPNSLAIFRELANTVVAGIHIVEEDQLQPSISQLKCAVDDKGVIDFSKVDKDVLPCVLTGKNLDKYSKLRLRNAADAVDPQTLDAAVAVTGDNTNATVNWPADGLHGLKDTNYLVYAVGQNGAEQKTAQAIHLDSGPYVVKAINTGTDNATFDGSKGAAAQTLQLSGFHLANVQKLTLTPVADAADKAGSRKAVTLAPTKGATPGDTTATFTFDTASLASLGEGSATLTLQVAETAGGKATTPKPVPSSITIAVTAKSAAPPKAPVPAKKKKKVTPVPAQSPGSTGNSHKPEAGARTPPRQ